MSALTPQKAAGLLGLLRAVDVLRDGCLQGMAGSAVCKQPNSAYALQPRSIASNARKGGPEPCSFHS
jgi:hypothetical protein